MNEQQPTTMIAQCWQPAKQHPPPVPGEIHVWRIELAAVVESDEVPVLSTDEFERAGRLLLEDKRTQFIAGRSALRRLLGQYLGAAPQALTFRYGPHGKPSLTGPTDAALTFNFSHSKGLALLAVANARVIGIDIEYRYRNISVAPFARHILTGSEVTALQQLPAERRRQALLSAWTRKEAYLKALGVGLSRSMTGFPAGIDDDNACVHQLEDTDGMQRPWTFIPLTVHPDYLACVAAPGCDWTLRCLDWQPAA